MISRRIGTIRLLGALAVLGSLTACGSSSPAADGNADPAVWDVDYHQKLSPVSTGFTAIVTRTGCSSGEQGRPEAPVIDAGATTITLTFRIQPHISGGSCEGTAGVAYRVHLPEPIGNRTLVDGACGRGSDLGSTSFCLQDGVRLTWRDGKPRLTGIQ